MRVAISGSHSVGKSTLIDGFLSRHPEYAHEPEAFEVLADDIEVTESGAPTPEGLVVLLGCTVAALGSRAAHAHVIFERSPVDYLAYAAAARRQWQPGETSEFLRAQVPIVRASLRHLDLLAYLPLPDAVSVRRRGEDRVYRRSVDTSLRRALLDDRYGLFADGGAPHLAVLPSNPEEQLGELCRLVQAADG